MTQEEKNRVFKAALGKYGAAYRLDLLVEELAELIVEIRHYQRGRGDWDSLAEETADVQIMLEQMPLILASPTPEPDNFTPAVKYFYDKKLARLERQVFDDE